MREQLNARVQMTQNKPGSSKIHEHLLLIVV
jgi:hypothetical protein